MHKVFYIFIKFTISFQNLVSEENTLYLVKKQVVTNKYIYISHTSQVKAKILHVNKINTCVDENKFQLNTKKITFFYQTLKFLVSKGG